MANYTTTQDSFSLTPQLVAAWLEDRKNYFAFSWSRYLAK